MRDHVIAVDVGTASVRAGVFDRRGTLLARRTHPLMLRQLAERRGVYASDDIWAAVVKAVRLALAAACIRADRVAGLAFGATCSLVLLDETGAPLPLLEDDGGCCDTIAWFDHRADGEADELTRSGLEAVRYCGGVVSPEMQIPKLMWLKRNRPELWRRAGAMLDLADFLTFRATGSNRRSVSTLASKWNYLPEQGRGFSDELLTTTGLEDLPERAGIDGEPLLVGRPVGQLSRKAADALGLDDDVVVAAGLIDAYAGALGVLPSPETKRAGDLALIAGTSSCLVGYAGKPVFADSLWGPYLSAVYPGQWLYEAGQSATGGLLNHLLELHSAGGMANEELHGRVIARIEMLIAENGPEFADGLDVLPDFHGNRSPFADPGMTGMISGLTLDRSFDSLCRLYWRACVAIALSLRQILDRLGARGVAIGRICLAGGHTRNPLLTSLYADATGRPIAVSASDDAVLLGSALNAASAAGLFGSLAEAAENMQATSRDIHPDLSLADYYDRQFERMKLLQNARRQLKSL